MSLLRFDSATALKSFFHLERALTINCAARVPSVNRLATKAALARAAWECSVIAESLRQRVFELRYPERDLSVQGASNRLHEIEPILQEPSNESFLKRTAEATEMLRQNYGEYLEASDEIADGPTFRILRHAVADKERQRTDLVSAAAGETAEIDTTSGYAIPDVPGRDEAYFSCSFYWPDNFDPAYPYGDGTRLQVRTAISHVNEVWATDTAGAILFGYADSLGWEFIIDAARWLYDESRHMTMGQRRLREWGIPDAEVPLGKYIYEASAGTGPLHRLGMLAYFETKNIGKKVERAEEFGRLGDDTGRRDMEFDWADEAIHAGYGRTWLRRAVEVEGRDGDTWDRVVKECEELVAERVARATDEEKNAIYGQAERVMELAAKGAA
jgi:hypothetical protein